MTTTRDLWPRVSVLEHGRPVVVDSFLMVFFLDRAACCDPGPVMAAFSAFIHGPGRGRLHFYVDEYGFTSALPADPMTLVAERVEEPAKHGEFGGLTLLDTDLPGGSHEVRYGCNPVESARRPDKKGFLAFRVGQDRVLEDGLEQMVAFVRRLTELLPYSYAYASPALRYGEQAESTLEVICRHPGFDVARPQVCAFDIDERPLGAYWLSVFSARMTEALGGAESLAARVPEASVAAAGQGGTMVILGSEPDVGDLERGNDLPLYRKLARVIEPMLRVPEGVYLKDRRGVTWPPLHEAWHRRFLIPDWPEVCRAALAARTPEDPSADDDLGF